MIQRTTNRLWGIAWRRWGKPTMTLVKPTTQWNLPAGYSLDPNTGNIRDEDGVVLANPSSYMTTQSIGVVPGDHAVIGTSNVAIDVPPDDMTVVKVRYSDLPAVREAQYVILDGENYDVVSDARSRQIAGNTIPADVILKRRRDDKRSTWSQWDRRWMGQ